MAGLVGVLAGLVARHELEHAHAATRRRAPRSVRIASSASARPEVLAVRKKTLSSACAGRGLQHREQRAERLADAGGRLRHAGSGRARAARYTASASGRWPARKSACGNASRRERRVARRAVRELLLGPGRGTLAALLEVRLQRRRRPALDEHRLVARVDVEVDQRQLDRRPAPARGTAASRRPAPGPSAARGGWPAGARGRRDGS